MSTLRNWVVNLLSFFRSVSPVQAERKNEINKFARTLTYQFRTLIMRQGLSPSRATISHRADLGVKPLPRISWKVRNYAHLRNLSLSHYPFQLWGSSLSSRTTQWCKIPAERRTDQYWFWIHQLQKNLFSFVTTNWNVFIGQAVTGGSKINTGADDEGKHARRRNEIGSPLHALPAP